MPEQVGRIHDRLRELFALAGHGSISQTERSLSLRLKYFEYNRRQKTLDLGALLAALDQLAVDPADFFRSIFGRGSDEPGDPDSFRTTTGKRPVTSPRALSSTKQPKPGLAGVDRSWLKAIDERRYNDPEAALVELWSRVRRVPECLVASYLAICGSCYRMIGSHTHARECLEAARDRTSPSFFDQGDIFLRLAYVENSAGAYKLARGLAEHAEILFLQAKSSPGRGQALIAQAMVLIHSRDFANAKQLLLRASRHVALSDLRHRFSIEQYFVTISREERNLAACKKHFMTARELAPSKFSEGMLFATLGELYSDLGHFEGAVKAIRKARDLLHKFPLNALLATVDLVDVLARQGANFQALEEAKNAKAYMGAVKNSKVGEAVLVRLYRAACAGRLRSGIVSQLRDAVVESIAAKRSDRLRDQLRRCRRLRGVSRRRAASEIGITTESLRKIEAGATPGDRYEPQLRSWISLSRPELLFIRPRSAGAMLPPRMRR